MAKSEDKKFFGKLRSGQITQRYQEFRKKSGQKVLVFLFFFGLSALIWFFNALGKDYSTYISFPVRYTNFPEGKILTNDLPDRLWLKVNAQGNIIFKYKLRSNINPVVFDVKSFASEQGLNGQQQFFVLTSMARERLQGQLNQEIQIADIEPDTLFFNLADTESKLVPVTANVLISMEKQYLQKGGIQISPDSVMVTGPSNILDSLYSISTEHYEFFNIHDTVTKNIDIQEINNIQVRPDEVNVTINAERFTESEVKIPIRVENLPDTIQLKTFPRQVTATFRVGLSDYEKVSPEMFRAIVRFDSTMLTAPPKKLQVELERYPGFISTVNYNPSSVDYILEK